ncbi:hypothetical protein QFZ61_003343 [Arthrobacter sp. B3I4]|nr:hypothetical protein [Arthrobacter sp. B3I4]
MGSSAGSQRPVPEPSYRVTTHAGILGRSRNPQNLDKMQEDQLFLKETHGRERCGKH